MQETTHKKKQNNIRRDIGDKTEQKKTRHHNKEKLKAKTKKHFVSKRRWWKQRVLEQADVFFSTTRAKMFLEGMWRET